MRFRAGSIVLAFLALAGCAASPCADRAPVRVQLLLVNDVYQLDPVAGRGGLARVATLVRRVAARDTEHLVRARGRHAVSFGVLHALPGAPDDRGVEPAGPGRGRLRESRIRLRPRDASTTDGGIAFPVARRQCPRPTDAAPLGWRAGRAPARVERCADGGGGRDDGARRPHVESGPYHRLRAGPRGRRASAGRPGPSRPPRGPDASRAGAGSGARPCRLRST